METADGRVAGLGVADTPVDAQQVLSALLIIFFFYNDRTFEGCASCEVAGFSL